MQSSSGPSCLNQKHRGYCTQLNCQTSRPRRGPANRTKALIVALPEPLSYAARGLGRLPSILLRHRKARKDRAMRRHNGMWRDGEWTVTIVAHANFRADSGSLRRHNLKLPDHSPAFLIQCLGTSSTQTSQRTQRANPKRYLSPPMSRSRK